MAAHGDHHLGLRTAGDRLGGQCRGRVRCHCQISGAAARSYASLSSRRASRPRAPVRARRRTDNSEGPLPPAGRGAGLSLRATRTQPAPHRDPGSIARLPRGASPVAVSAPLAPQRRPCRSRHRRSACTMVANPGARGFERGWKPRMPASRRAAAARSCCPLAELSPPGVGRR
jgi:hypothetical protein